MELKNLKELKRVYDLNKSDLEPDELQTLAEIDYVLQLIIDGVMFELPDQKEIIAKGMELAKQGKLLNDKASIKDYLFGFIDGFRYTKQKRESKGN